MTSRPPESISLQMVVETPENIRLEYQLAGPAIRCLAFGLDSLIRALLTAFVMLVAMLTSGILPGITWGIVLLFLFALEWGYHILLEGLFRGKTLGKDAVGLRVVQSEGYPITFWAAVQRNLLRAVDGIPLVAFLAVTTHSTDWFYKAPEFGDFRSALMMMPIYGPAWLAMVLSGRFQRLGDLVAGTVVVSERRTYLDQEPVIFEKIQPLTKQEINTTIPDPTVLGLVDDFLHRREELTHERGHEICASFAQEVAALLDYQGDDYQLQEYPMAFLARVYVTFTPGKEDDIPVAELMEPSEVETIPAFEEMV